MKTLLFLFSLLVISSCQPSNKGVIVPDAIRKTFQKMHPNATSIHWIQEPSIFEAKFEDGAMQGAVSFNEAGEVVETEEVIEKEQLPHLDIIEDYIKTNYAGEAIRKCEKIVKKDSTIIYEVQITGKELVFDSQGTFLEEEPD